MNYMFLLRMFKTSIGRKQLMSVSGLLMIFFMLVHLAENMLLFKGEQWYNGWVDILLSNPLTPFLELFFLIIFLLHIIMGIWVRIEDWNNSRFRKYEMINWQGGRTLGSSTMLYTAIIILVYLVFHLFHFKFTDHSVGFYQMVTSAFRDTTFVVIYVTGSLALALHLSHGFQSSFQTLGIHHPRYNFWIKLTSYIIAVAMVGFAVIALYFYFGIDIKPDVNFSNPEVIVIE